MRRLIGRWPLVALVPAAVLLAGCAPVKVTYFSVPLMRGEGAQVEVGRVSPQKFFLFEDERGNTTAVEACTPTLQLPSLPAFP